MWHTHLQPYFWEGVFVVWDQRICLRRIRHWWQRNEDSPYQTSPSSYLEKYFSFSMQLFSRHRERWNYLILHYILPQKRKAGEQWDWYPWLVWSLRVIWLNHSQVAVRLERSWESHPHRQSYWDITSRQEARLKKKTIYFLILGTRSKTWTEQNKWKQKV